MNWKKVDYGVNEGWIYYFNGDNSHYLRVGEYDRIGNYYVHYCLNGSLHINEPITANNMNKAKEKAVQMMRKYLKKQRL